MTKTTLRFKVTGMKCDGCVARVREALTQIPGVLECNVDLAASRAVVTGDVDPNAVSSALTALGYATSVEEN